jgi:hypothetical protein
MRGGTGILVDYMYESAPAKTPQKRARVAPATRKAVHIERVGFRRSKDAAVIRIAEVRGIKAGWGYRGWFIEIVGLEALYVGSNDWGG